MKDPSELGVINDFHGDRLPEPRSGYSCTGIKCLENPSIFIYGDISMLNTPLNNAWILEISEGLQVKWTPYPLSYDHGQV